MAHDMDALSGRLRVLEQQVRVFKIIAVGAVVLAVVLATVPRPTAQQAVEQLRVRQLIVEDGDGRSRMVIGYLDAAGNTRRLGLRVNDPRGAERFGLFYMENGAMGMGFDAPPGTGDDRNRERITIVADETGGAHIRFLDRRTSVAARWYLDEQNRAWMQFSDFTQKPAVFRRYGLSGEEINPTK